MSALYAATREGRVDELRRDGIDRAIRHLLHQRPRAALEFMLMSVEQQARCAGVGFVELPRADRYVDDDG